MKGIFVRRRTLLKGCSALALLAGARLSGLALAAPVPDPQDRLVILSLRGGWDSLTAVVPRGGEDRRLYLEARPTLGVRRSLDLNGAFGLHPALIRLYPRWQAGQLAVVLAAGISGSDSRSHFESIASMETGATSRRGGWLGRYLNTLPGTAGFPGLALGAPSLALQGFSSTLTLNSLADLDFQLPREDLLVSLYAGADPLQRSGAVALQALRTARKLARQPDRLRPTYPDSEFGLSLREAARLLSCRELGVRALTLELDGWDSHTEQAEVVPALLSDLAEGLATFLDDMQGQSVTVVVLSEFGRRLAENASGGTDHGHGSTMLVLGESIRGGLYGQWPGLAKEQLFDLEDLQVTCDYRRVLGELLAQRMGCRNLESVFPGSPLLPPLGFTQAAV